MANFCRNLYRFGDFATGCCKIELAASPNPYKPDKRQRQNDVVRTAKTPDSFYNINTATFPV
jgi:hypothetical protein